MGQVESQKLVAGVHHVMNTAMLAWAPLWGCTLAHSAPKISFRRSMATFALVYDLTAAVVTAPGRPSAYLLVITEPWLP